MKKQRFVEGAVRIWFLSEAFTSSNCQVNTTGSRELHTFKLLGFFLLFKECI